VQERDKYALMHSCTQQAGRQAATRRFAPSEQVGYEGEEGRWFIHRHTRTHSNNAAKHDAKMRHVFAKLLADLFSYPPSIHPSPSS